MNSNPNSNGLLIGIVIVLIILVGLAFLLDNSTIDEEMLQNTATNNRNEENSQNQANDGVTFITTTTSTTTSGGSPTDTAFTIKTDDLSQEQKAMLTASGFDGSDIVITNEMKACAEQSIGAERTQQFADGQKPTVIEAGKLLVCYNQ